MKLTTEQIRSAARGIVRADEKDGLTNLYRFTKEQEELYFKRSADFFNKSFATAGVVLEFTTNSESLTLSVVIAPGSSRTFFSHSIHVNGKKYASLSCDGANRGSFSGSWTLPAGDKQVKIYFPWSVSSRIAELSLDDGATFEPVVRKTRMIMFGDSITHGYDALTPENSYASRVADALDADAVDKGIGAEVFYGEMAAAKDPFDPDYITVAYGTNDWSKNNKESFEIESKLFYENLSKSYPNAKIFALTPIWRKNYGAVNTIGNLNAIGEYIAKVTADLPNVIVLNGIDFIPHSPEYFAPDVLHPNDKGFKHYAENLLEEMKKHI